MAANVRRVLRKKVRHPWLAAPRRLTITWRRSTARLSNPSLSIRRDAWRAQSGLERYPRINT